MNRIEIVKQAITDLELCEKDPNYRINMTYWHFWNGRECLVCLGGAYISQTMKAPVNQTIIPDRYNAERFAMLAFLNGVRTKVESKGFYYAFDPDGFKKAILELTEKELDAC